MSEEYNNITCNTCGIEFKFRKNVEELWRKSEKTFFCPNGHSLAWSKPKESEEQVELKKLKVEVNELRTKLVAAEKQSEVQKKRVEELTTELEIWRPSTADDKKVG